MSLLEVIYQETYVARTELMFVEMATRCRRCMVMNQLDLMPTLEANEHKSSYRTRHTSVISPLARGRFETFQDIEPELFSIKPNHGG